MEAGGAGTGEQHQHPLVLLHRELLRHSQGHVGDVQALHDRIRGLVHEHHGPAEDAGVLEAGPEEVVVVEDQAQAPEDHDVGVGLDADAGEEGIEKLLHLIRSYFKLNGHHIQFNIVDSQTLREAQTTPDEYRDLLVRVAGYSDYFVDLTEELQDEIIRRTEHKGTEE